LTGFSGFVVSIFLYSTLSYFFSAKEPLVETTIYRRDDSSQLSDKEHPTDPNYEKDFGNSDAVNVARDADYPQEKILEFYVGLILWILC